MFAVIGLRRPALAVLVLVPALWACAGGPPVQEMSDARQAIAAAREAGAEQLAAERLGEATDSLAAAEQYLQDRVYWAARREAIQAKESALDALLRSRAAREAASP